MCKKGILIVCLAGISLGAIAQTIGVKTNLLYGGLTLTPNISVEIGVGEQSTLELGGRYNPWNLNGRTTDNKKLVHWLGQAEYRHWICQKFNGHFWGVHLLGTQYNISGVKLPLLFGRESGEYRHQGWAVGGGMSYGYQFILGRYWNLELNIGVGYARLKYDKYECRTCGEKVGTETKDYLGPTKAGISLIYILK